MLNTHPAVIAASAAAFTLLLVGCAPTPADPAAPEAPLPAASSHADASTPIDEHPPGDDIALVDQAGAEATASDTAPLSESCKAEAVQALVGQVASEAVVEQATRDSHAGSVRILKPGQPMTLDFRGDRLNIDTDDAGVIQSLRCG